MISAALYNFLSANSGAASIYPSQGPQNAALPCLIIDKIGDDRDRMWHGGTIQKVLTTSEFELTVWADTQIACTNEANALITLFDNYIGSWTDTSSPNVIHRIAFVEAEDNGWQHNPIEKLYSASLFLSIQHT